MINRLTYAFASPASSEVVEISAQEFALMAEDAGCTVEDLRATFTADPLTTSELADAARLAKRASQGQEPLTYLKP